MVQLLRAALVTLLLVASLLGGPTALADHDVEHRIAQFWERVNAMQPTQFLSAQDAGGWALNVVERDNTVGLTTADFRAIASSMQIAFDRAGPGVAVAPTRPAPTNVEQRIAEFWQRVNASQPVQLLSAQDVGGWALNVVDRDRTVRMTVADFRAIAASMQAAFDLTKTATPTPNPVATRPSLPAYVSVVRGPSATEADVAVVRDAVARGVGYLQAVWAYTPAPFEVRVDVIGSPILNEQHDPGQTTAIQTGAACCGLLERLDGLAFAVNQRFWTEIARGGPQGDGTGYALSVAANRVKIATHEAAHLWNESMGCDSRRYNRRPVISPLWMVEGVAELYGLRAAVAAGLLEQSVLDRYLRTNPLGKESVQPPLEALENLSSLSEHGYHMGAAAMDRLLTMAGAQSMVTFCTTVAGGRVPWQSAFSTAFGVTPAAFYADFKSSWVGYYR